jgi:flagellar biosynthetic protein FlhB
MADEDQDSKTEEPTGKRLNEAHQRGDVVTSTEVKTWVMLAGGSIIVLYMAPWISGRLRVYLTRFIEQPHAISFNIGSVQRLLLDMALEVAFLLVMPMGLLIVLTFATSVLQHGWVWSTDKMKPDLNKVNPWTGFKRMFSFTQLLELLKGILKLGVVGGVVTFVVWPRYRHAEAVMSMDLPGQLAYLMDAMHTVLFAVLGVIFLIAVADYAYQHWEYIKKMRMTKQEVKDENKQQEGDPHVKGRIRSLRIQRSRERMMQAVPTANVVVTNPTHYAVALKYDMGVMAAPVVVAKGVDHLALRIRAIAEENGVAIVENPPLARTLYAAVDVDQEIRPDHYKAVAEVIGFVMRLKGKGRP